MIADQVSYVIVANDIFEGYLDEFVEWKTKKGFNIDLVYTNQNHLSLLLMGLKLKFHQLEMEHLQKNYLSKMVQLPN